MSRLFFFVFFLVIVSSTMKGQSLSPKELRLIHDDISIYLGNKEQWKGGPTRNSEYVVCFLGVDTAGKINSIRIIADEKNTDSTAIYLKAMPVEVFNKRVFNNCKGKTIVLPIFSYSYKKVPPYLEEISKAVSGKLEDIKEVGNVVYAPAMRYNAPTVSH